MSETLTDSELSTRSHMMRNYFVDGQYFGIKVTVLIHVGFGSDNHLVTIRDIFKNTYGKAAIITTVRPDTRKMQEIGVGKDYPY